MTHYLRNASGLLFCLVTVREAQAATRYAKVSATGSGNCTSWANACTLGSAILAAQPSDDVWVKAGIYPPFEMKNGVRIIGGFAGTETLASQSNPMTNVTVVDGEESWRCVASYDDGPGTVLRGFKLVNGNDQDDPRGGGGLLLSNSKATIVQCTFENNTAAYVGGAVMIRESGSSPTFINCIFRHNGATWPSDDPPYGGGAVLILDAQTVDFVNCLFHDNTAWEGGAVETNNETVLTLSNCTLANNHATVSKGGALYDLNGKATLHNCILWGNTAARGAPYANQIYSFIYRTTVTYSDVQGGWSGTGNLNADPRFKNSVGNYVLQFTSPCKNGGENTALPPDLGDLDWDANTAVPIPLDLAGFTRILLGTVDMGAYEYDCHYASTDCNQNGVADACEIEADPTLDCHNNNVYLDLCEATSAVPKGACCVEDACEWPTTSCRCTANGGMWHQDMTCNQVTCHLLDADY